MKKIYTLILSMLCVLGAQAIELSFWLGNQKITPGSTVEFTDIIVDDYESYIDVKMEPAIYLSTNIYSSDVKVTARCTSGESIEMCAGGLCKGGEEVVKDKVTLRPAQKLDLEFHFWSDYDSVDDIPVVITEFEAEDTTEPGSKVTFTLVMKSPSASVSEIESDNGIQAVAGGLKYDFGHTASLSICTVDGVCLYSSKVNGSGIVALERGLYIVSVDGAGKKVLIN